MESPSDPNHCDVIHHLHGDQRRQEMQKSPNSQVGMSPIDPNTAQYMRSKISGRLPDKSKCAPSCGILKNDCRLRPNSAQRLVNVEILSKFTLHKTM